MNTSLLVLDQPEGTLRRNGAILKPIVPDRALFPAQELMLAVLRQALDDYGRSLSESRGRARRERQALERWIFHDDFAWPFSYRNVCEGVQIDPYALRRELRRWPNQGMRSVRPARNPATPFRLPHRTMRGTRTRIGPTT